MKTLLQLLQLTILLPLWGTLFALTLLFELMNRSVSAEEAYLKGLRIAAGAETGSPARQEVMLTARIAQV